MKKFLTFWGVIGTFLLFQMPFLLAAENIISLFDAAKISKTEEFAEHGVTFEGVTPELKNKTLNVTSNTTNPWPGIHIQGNWNLEHHSEMLLVVTNHDDADLTLHCRLDSPRPSENMKNSLTNSVTLASGETKQWRFTLPANVPQELKEKFFGMRGTPFGKTANNDSTFDTKEISLLILFVTQSKKERHWSVKSISAKPSETLAANVSADKFFPMIDKYGQYIHKDWQGKIHNDGDFQKASDAEKSDLAKNPSPKNWDKYGGWTAGTKLKATGHFRVEKIDGKWWFVDPDGYLFWSHGTDCVITGNAVTPTTDREFYFAELPSRGGEFASCFGTGNWAPHNYYENRGTYATFDFSKANIIRKYGGDWENIYKNLVHQRLRSWGMNTIANWSSPQFYSMRRTPYTENLGINAQPIRGSEGYWGKFLDPFDSQFRESIRRSAERAAETSGKDSWCLGYFVQNEISWGNETSLAFASLTSPADQPAKIAVVEYLQKKYESVEKLNDVWKTNYKDWNELLQATSKPDEKLAKNDLVECYSLIAEQYFRVISEELHKACPDKLYLGCRFAWGNDVAITAASKFCDVISFNKYQYNLDDFKLPDGADKPCIIGEFHFGALDRGMFHTGLCPTESQTARADAYRRYVTSALLNPYLIGTHWFQYMDQATTGRGDGENYQIGLVSAVDTPYPETIAAVREIGEKMYETRKGKK